MQFLSRCAIIGRGHEEHFCEFFFKFEPIVKQTSFKYILIYSSGVPVVLKSGRTCAILAEGIMRIISVKLF